MAAKFLVHTVAGRYGSAVKRSRTLDYTCITLGQFIWEEIRSYIFNMAIMCPKGSLPKTAVLTYHADYKLITKIISHSRKEQHLKPEIAVLNGG